MIAGLWRRLLEIVRPSRIDREMREELAHHVELLVASKMDAGIDEAEARRQARIELGSVESAREQVVTERSGYALEQAIRESAYAARVLRRSPGTTILSIVTMAAGIGVSGVLFTLVSTIVLRPLPYPEAERLVRIFDTNLQAGIERTGTATGNIGQWRNRATGFDGLAGYYAMGRTISVDGDADAAITAQVSQDFFDVIGVGPALGRSFTAEEAERARFNSASAPIGADPVVMLSHGIWLRRFGGDPRAIGRIVQLERRPFKVIGVMPPGFALPDPGVQLWIPWRISPDDPRDQHYVSTVARLKAGVSLEQAEAQLNTVARDLGDAHPETNRGWGARLSPLATETVGRTASLLWVLLGAVGLVLVVACANVALLAMIRGVDRREETAVRVAIGASSTRLLREFLLESFLLSLAGGTIGVVIAIAGVQWLPSLITDLPRLDEVAFDYRALTFIAVVTVLSAVLSGVPQAWKRTRGLSAIPLTSSARAGADAGSHRLRDAIVIIQVAMAVILMTGSGLLVRSFLHLRGTDPGFDPRGVLVAPVFLDNQQYTTGDHTRTYYRTLFERLRAIPGVVAVGGATTVPSSPLGPDFERPVWPAAAPDDPSTRVPAAVRMITSGYMEAMSLRLVQGRAIDDRDSPQSPRVLMISETLAARLWPGRNAVGQQLVVDYSTAGTYPYEIIGVIGDLRFRGPRSAPLPEIYLPHAQRSYLILNVVVKTTGDPRALIPAVRAALKEVDPQKPAQNISPLVDLLGASYARDRQAMVTLLVFAAAATFLAALSVYGVLSQRVRERAREIGIRMAMGASAASLVGWVAASGLRLIAVGLAIGMAAAYALAGLIQGLLFGVQTTDGVTTIATLSALAALGVIATVIPSWRATRINPVEILRRG